MAMDEMTTAPLVDELRARAADGAAVVEALRGELARVRAATDEVVEVLGAAVRHAGEAVAVVDADLAVRFASPTAAARLGAGPTLAAALPPGGAFAVRRFLDRADDAGAVAGAGDAGDTGPGPEHTLVGDGVEVTVLRVEPRRGRLGGLWGAAPGRAHGLVTFAAPA